MKRAFSVLLLIAVLALGCACGRGQSAEPADYAAAIQSARTDEYNEAYPIYSDGEGDAFAVTCLPEGVTAEDMQGQAQMAWELLGLTREDVQRFAFSVSLMNVRSYAVAVVLPAEGRTDSVTGALEDFVQLQMLAQQNYLADQYEIAADARIFSLPDGAVALVMSEDAATVADKLQTALK